MIMFIEKDINLKEVVPVKLVWNEKSGETAGKLKSTNQNKNALAAIRPR